MTTIYHDIGSRIKHCRTGIDDQISDYYVLAWIYPALDEVACEFPDPDPELCPFKV